MSPRKSGTVQRNNPNHPQRPRCVIASPNKGEGLFQRNHIHHDKAAGDGVSTYLALTFGTLLSSQGTEAAIGNRFRFPSGLSLRYVPTLSDAFQCLTPSQRGLSFRPCGRSDE
jgi:hypothetical protein